MFPLSTECNQIFYFFIIYFYLSFYLEFLHKFKTVFSFFFFTPLLHLTKAFCIEPRSKSINFSPFSLSPSFVLWSFEMRCASKILTSNLVDEMLQREKIQKSIDWSIFRLLEKKSFFFRQIFFPIRILQFRQSNSKLNFSAWETAKQEEKKITKLRPFFHFPSPCLINLLITFFFRLLIPLVPSSSNID